MANLKNRTYHDLSFTHLTATNMGDLIPIYCEEIYPGDTFDYQAVVKAQFEALLGNAFINVDVFLHAFFVPNRLNFDGWEDFISGGLDGQNATVPPTIEAPEGGFTKYSLADFFGFPLGKAGIKVSALPFRAYNLIYNEFYRNQDLQEALGWTDAPGIDNVSNLAVQKRNWMKDYFTSSLPFQQRGPAVTIPVGANNAPVVGNGIALGLTDGSNLAGLSSFGSGASGNAEGYLRPVTTSYGLDVGVTSSGPSGTNRLKTNIVAGVTTDPTKSGLIADLASATGITIEQLRLSERIQFFMEKTARSGVKYIDLLRAFFGVKSSDARLQRPEFLGGGRAPVIVTEVLQTSATTSTSPQGNIAGHAVSLQRIPRIRKSFEEHGILMVLCSVMPRTGYMQGINRKWTRTNRYDYWWDVFERLGEQAILNKEIFAQGPSVTDNLGNPVDDNVFGYAPRYDELRQNESLVTSDMRDNLSFMHLMRQFDSLPTLSSDFVKANVPTRIFATEKDDDKHVWLHVYNKVDTLREIGPRRGAGLISI